MNALASLYSIAIWLKIGGKKVGPPGNVTDSIDLTVSDCHTQQPFSKLDDLVRCYFHACVACTVARVSINRLNLLRNANFTMYKAAHLSHVHHMSSDQSMQPLASS
eukprot:m.174718 g.174718  ORF g.174718 m.174718 type:complete len:106 (+) comp16755_c0_seq6:630-947(+)